MWPKTFSLVLAVILIVTVCMPAVGHDGRILNTIDPEQDEHPWGGEHNNNGSDEPIYSSEIPDIDGISYYFIRLTFRYTLTSVQIRLIKRIRMDQINHPLDDTVPPTTGPSNDTNPTTGSGN